MTLGSIGKHSSKNKTFPERDIIKKKKKRYKRAMETG